MLPVSENLLASAKVLTSLNLEQEGALSPEFIVHTWWLYRVFSRLVAFLASCLLAFSSGW
jgi:hypothetical protein